MKKRVSALAVALVSSIAVSAELEISRTNLKANVPGSDNTAAYMLVENTSNKDVRIIGAQSDVAEFTELHTHTMDGDRMMMRHIEHLDIDSGESVRFAPNGYHVMLINLKQRLKHGEQATITFQYDDGTSQDVPFDIIDPRKLSK
ncbi:copper chaperone PCu(A)C [Marinomonas epiphytica]